jgi:hypothetical protein
MKELSEKEIKLIARLETLPRGRRIYGIIIIGSILGYWVYSIIRHPLMANPFYVLSELKKGTYPKDLLVVVAGLIPLLYSICFFLLLLAVVLGITGVRQRNELLGIIQKLINNENNKNA